MNKRSKNGSAISEANYEELKNSQITDFTFEYVNGGVFCYYVGIDSYCTNPPLNNQGRPQGLFYGQIISWQELISSIDNVSPWANSFGGGGDEEGGDEDDGFLTSPTEQGNICQAINDYKNLGMQLEMCYMKYGGVAYYMGNTGYVGNFSYPVNPSPLCVGSDWYNTYCLPTNQFYGVFENYSDYSQAVQLQNAGLGSELSSVQNRFTFIYTVSNKMTAPARDFCSTFWQFTQEQDCSLPYTGNQRGNYLPILYEPVNDWLTGDVTSFTDGDFLGMFKFLEGLFSKGKNFFSDFGSLSCTNGEMPYFGKKRDILIFLVFIGILFVLRRR